MPVMIKGKKRGDKGSRNQNRLADHKMVKNETIDFLTKINMAVPTTKEWRLVYREILRGPHLLDLHPSRPCWIQVMFP